MIINYSDKPVIKTKNSIFLAGPTPRSKDIPSWRNEALKILKDIQYNKVNVEFGYWLAKDPNKVYYGRPEDADKIKYLDWLYTKETGRYTTKHLDMLIKLAVNSLMESI